MSSPLKNLSFVLLLFLGKENLAGIVAVTTIEEGNKLTLQNLELTTSSTLPNRIATWRDLIKAQVIDFRSVPENNQENFISIFGTPDGPPLTAAARYEMIRDPYLNTGLFNPATSGPGLTIRFDQPVVNQPGDDIVLFELSIGVGQAPDGIIVFSNDGRGNSRAYNSANYEYVANINAAQRPEIYWMTVDPNANADFAQLGNLSITLGSPAPTNPKYHAVSINLSHLGIPIGESVETLTILSQSNSTAVDVLMIVAMPNPIPEPKAFGLAILIIFGTGIYRYFTNQRLRYLLSQ